MIPNPRAIEMSTNMMATITWIKRSVTFLSNLLPINAPAMAAKVAEMSRLMFSWRFAAENREA
jgi:hypothetical protein